MSGTPKQTWQSWAEFLANAPPSSTYQGADIVQVRYQPKLESLATPEIKTYCDGECEDIRYFDSDYNSASLKEDAFSCFKPVLTQ